ncbi:hypothetical protein FY134_26370 (plasmid) [Agrobacterium fabrum]|uniref:aquaporin n=1 Tax=Agrobacterium fabrum TaxID=1176649 RepID=UPI00220E3A95|nr:hypothetical protein FY134_26370 [Agrobacterium fabrum]
MQHGPVRYARTSGANLRWHFNPAVSLAMLLRGVVRWCEAAAYVSEQVAGSILGVVLVHLMFELPPIAFSAHVRHGFAQWFSEAISTFGLVFVILLGIKFRPQVAPAIVGVYVLLSHRQLNSSSLLISNC